MPSEQGFVAAERVEEAAGEKRQPVLLARAAVDVELAGRRRAVEVVEDTGVADHREAGVDVGVFAGEMNDAGPGDAEQKVVPWCMQDLGCLLPRSVTGTRQAEHGAIPVPSASNPCGRPHLRSE